MQQPPPPNFYVLGSTIQLTPVANPGYAFVGWGGDASGLNYPYSLTLDTNKTIIAYFKLAGDDFITALPLSGSAITAHGSNVSFTKEPGEPWHAGNPGQSRRGGGTWVQIRLYTPASAAECGHRRLFRGATLRLWPKIPPRHGKRS